MRHRSLISRVDIGLENSVQVEEGEEITCSDKSPSPQPLPTHLTCAPQPEQNLVLAHA